MNTKENRQDDEPLFACLAIEMATGVGSVAAGVGGRTCSREFVEPQMQSRHIYNGVREVLDELELELGGLHCIAFGCGPGSFTGLRVAAAAAQALAYGADLPVARISSLAALAAGAAHKHAIDCIAPCLDARMGEAYLAVYRGGSVDALCAVMTDGLVDPQQFRLPAGQNFFAAGPGWSACPDLVDNHATQIIGSDFALMPSAIGVLALAAEQFRDGRTIAAEQALPNYIRDKVTY